MPIAHLEINLKIGAVFSTYFIHSNRALDTKTADLLMAVRVCITSLYNQDRDLSSMEPEVQKKDALYTYSLQLGLDQVTEPHFSHARINALHNLTT